MSNTIKITNNSQKLRNLNEQKAMSSVEKKLQLLEFEVARLEAETSEIVRVRTALKGLMNAVDRMIMHHLSKFNKKVVVEYDDSHLHRTGHVAIKGNLIKQLRISDLENFYDNNPDNTLAFILLSTPYVFLRKIIKWTHHLIMGTRQK